MSKHIGYRWHRQILDILPVLVASSVVAALTYAVGMLLSLPLYMDGLLKLALFVALYAVWSVLFRSDAYLLFCEAAKPFIKNIKGKKNKGYGKYHENE